MIHLYTSSCINWCKVQKRRGVQQIHRNRLISMNTEELLPTSGGVNDVPQTQRVEQHYHEDQIA